MNNPWNNLSKPEKDVTARRIDHTHPLDLFWATDHLGHFLFIFEYSQNSQKVRYRLPDLVGIQILSSTIHNNSNKDQLILLLKENKNWEMFLSLCNDLIQVTYNIRNTDDAYRIILERLNHWQAFLRSNRSNLLSEEEIVGLIGELLFIKNDLIPVFGPSQSVNFWHGPEDSPQDFYINDCAFEIKCLSGNASSVRISSIDQLCPQLPAMYLTVITLGRTTLESSNAINLPILVHDISEKIISDTPSQIERFNDLLHNVGYIESDRYLEFNYLFLYEKTFLVSNNFPRVNPKDVQSGIINLTYSIDLVACSPFEDKPDWMRKKE